MRISVSFCPFILWMNCIRVLSVSLLVSVAVLGGGGDAWALVTHVDRHLRCLRVQAYSHPHRALAVQEGVVKQDQKRLPERVWIGDHGLLRARLGRVIADRDVLALMGDDHGAESSTVPHQSEFAMMDAMIPILHPAGLQEILDYGIYGFALSRYSGCWVGLKCVHDNIESAGIETPRDFINLTPNVTLVETQNAGNAFINVRGISQARNSEMSVAVLVDGVVAIGASDAGIYVGQSRNVVVKNSRAEYNVAGIEIGNDSPYRWVTMNQVIAVANGFVAIGEDGGEPAAWRSESGRRWDRVPCSRICWRSTAFLR